MSAIRHKTWIDINKKIGDQLLNQLQYPRGLTRSLGKSLFNKAKNQTSFKENNGWFRTGRNLLGTDGFRHRDVAIRGFVELDPLQLFLSIHMSTNSDNRTKRVKALYELLDIPVDFTSIDFKGCPTPLPAQAIKFRNKNDVKALWKLFTQVKNNRVIFNPQFFSEYLVIRGIGMPMLSIFCFWLRPEKYMPIDRYTVAYLVRLGKISLQESLMGDVKLFIRLNTDFDYLEGQTTVELVKQSYEKGNSADSKNANQSTPKLKFKLLGFKLLSRNEPFHKILNYKEHSNTWYILDKRLHPLPHVRNKEERVLFDFADTNVYNDGLTGINVNINAIVGKNGSGKSSLLDLLNMLIFNLAWKHKLITEDRSGKDLKVLRDVNFEVCFEYEFLFKWQSTGNYTRLFQGVKDDENSKEYKFILVPEEDELNFISVFFTIVANYSIYSLNSSQYIVDSVEWLSALTHKNDGYQTPIVISPQRVDDMINVNREKELNKSRLLLNLLTLHDYKSGTINLKEGVKSEGPNKKLTDSFRNFDNGKMFTYVKILGASSKVLDYNVKIGLKTPKRRELLTLYRRSSKIKGVVLENIIGYFEHLPSSDIDRLFKNIADFFKIPGKEIETAHKLYLIIKLVKIVFIYNYDPEAKEYFVNFVRKRENFNFKFTTLLERIVKDNSHVTDKFKQVISYYRLKVLTGLYKNGKLLHLNEINYAIDQVVYANFDQRSYKIHPAQITFHYKHYVIPPIFDYQFYYNDKIEAKSISSGEEQLITVMSNVLYHIRNIASKYHMGRVTDAIQYKNINIVMDEIELYFHPEYQRKFVNRLIRSLKKLVLDDVNIESVNVLFTTHSPFILSDIPSQKILKLEDGRPFEKERPGIVNSFAANIYDLLKDDFFMTGGAMGEFANEFIERLLHQLMNADYKDTEFKEELKTKIDLIGEPLIRNSLYEIWRKKFEELSYDDLLKKIKTLESAKHDTN